MQFEIVTAVSMMLTVASATFTIEKVRFEFDTTLCSSIISDGNLESAEISRSRTSLCGSKGLSGVPDVYASVKLKGTAG